MRIDVAPRPHEVVDEDVWIGDSGPFVFTASGVADLLSALLVRDLSLQGFAVLQAKLAWLEEGLAWAEEPDEDKPGAWDHLHARLTDPDDPLDTRHLLDVYEALTEAVTQRPTSSSGGSSPQRQTKGGAGARKPKASTSGG